MKRLLPVVLPVALLLAACQNQPGVNRAMTPIPPKTLALMSKKGMSQSDPILVRVYKKESELEVWKKVNGHYAHLKTFPICRWSGQLGPKVREGDRQAPEGFYTVTPALMNPNSSFYLSFDTGYPNAYDRAHKRTGSHLMVHGDCSSRGCYAMTDEGIAEVYALAREAFSGGQRGFQLQAFPFRMTPANLARYRQDPNMPFWKNLKQGSDHFEITRREPKVSVCERRYAFNTVGDECKEDPTLAPAIAQKEENDRREVAELVAKGTPAVRLVYADGGQHPSFRPPGAAYGGRDSASALTVFEEPKPKLGQVSRPEALEEGPREVALEGPRDNVRTTGSTPDGKRPGRTVLASADPEAPVTLPRQAEPEMPVHERMMSRILGRRESAPTPPSRAAEEAASKPRAADPKAKPSRKPLTEAQARSRERPAQAERSGRLLSGAAPLGPGASAFARN